MRTGDKMYWVRDGAGPLLVRLISRDEATASALQRLPGSVWLIEVLEGPLNAHIDSVPTEALHPCDERHD